MLYQDQRLTRWTAAFLVVFLGVVLAGQLRVLSGGGFLLALVLGFVAGWIARDRWSVPVLWLAIGLTYPVSLATGAIVFLEDFWWVAYLLACALASVGALGGILLRSLFGAREPTRPRPRR